MTSMFHTEKGVVIRTDF